MRKKKKNRCIRKLFAKFIKSMTIVQHTFLYGKVANADAFPVFDTTTGNTFAFAGYCSFGAKDFT